MYEVQDRWFLNQDVHRTISQRKSLFEYDISNLKPSGFGNKMVEQGKNETMF